MKPILLDTHILIWLDLEPERLGKRRIAMLKAMEKARIPMMISAITLREVAQQAARGRVVLAKPFALWLNDVERHPAYRVMPLTAEVASESVRLGALEPGDPADQIIVATARCAGVALMTDDERMRKSGLVPVV